MAPVPLVKQLLSNISWNSWLRSPRHSNRSPVTLRIALSAGRLVQCRTVQKKIGYGFISLMTQQASGVNTILVAAGSVEVYRPP